MFKILFWQNVLLAWALPWTIFEISTKRFELDSNPDYWCLCAWVDMLFQKKNFNTICFEVKHYHLKEVSKISIYICTLTIEVMIAVTLGHLPDIQPHWMRKFAWFLQITNIIYNNRITQDESFNIITFTSANSWFITGYPFHPIFNSSSLVLWRCPWSNGYRRRNWTRWHKLKSWMRLIAFHIALIPLGKVWIQLFSLQLWVNSGTD